MIFIIPSDYRGIFNIVLYNFLYHHIFILDKIKVMAVAYGNDFSFAIKVILNLGLFWQARSSKHKSCITINIANKALIP